MAKLLMIAEYENMFNDKTWKLINIYYLAPVFLHARASARKLEMEN